MNANICKVLYTHILTPSSGVLLELVVLLIGLSGTLERKGNMEWTTI